MEFLDTVFMPHGHCYYWHRGILYLHVLSDAAIVLAYFSIPVALVRFVRNRKDLTFKWMFLMFGAFILLCGTSHLMEIVTNWVPAYWIEGGVKAMTGAVSLATAALLWPLIPKALALPSPAQLAAKNEELEREMEQRARIEEELRLLNQELERRVEQRTLELRRSNEDLEEFASIVSHDLREPLRAVAGYTDLLRKQYEGELDDKADEYIGAAVEGASRMSDMLNDLLRYSRIGSHEIQDEEADLNAVFESAQRAVASRVEEIDAEIRREGFLPRVQGNENLLVQVLQNLFTNSLKYHGRERCIVEVSARRSGDLWEISVTDNGIGIDPEQAERIFQPFHRLDPSADHEGTGIGLTVVRRIVEKHGGRVWAEPAPQRGATIKLTLRPAPQADDRDVS